MSASAGCGHWQKRALAEIQSHQNPVGRRSDLFLEMLHRSE